MEVLIEIIGEVLLEILQEIWPPVLAVVDGALVLLFGFLTWLFFSQGEAARAVISLLVGALFLAIGITGFRTGLYTRSGRTNRRRKR